MGSIGRFGVAFATANGLSIGSAAAGTRDANALVDSLAQDNMLRVLAEPNLTVMSGQPGSFLTGGEYPVPVAQKDNVVTVPAAADNVKNLHIGYKSVRSGRVKSSAVLE